MYWSYFIDYEYIYCPKYLNHLQEHLHIVYYINITKWLVKANILTGSARNRQVVRIKSMPPFKYLPDSLIRRYAAVIPRIVTPRVHMCVIGTLFMLWFSVWMFPRADVLTCLFTDS